MKEFSRWLFLTCAWGLGVWAFAFVMLNLVVKLAKFILR